MQTTNEGTRSIDVDEVGWKNDHHCIKYAHVHVINCRICQTCIGKEKKVGSPLQPISINKQEMGTGL
jgi:hypothetical protein